MTISTKPFRTLHDAMHDRHNNTDVPLTYLDANNIPNISAPVSDRVDETELVLFAKQHQLADISHLRDDVVGRGESWPPRRAWFDGYITGFNSRYRTR